MPQRVRNVISRMQARAEEQYVYTPEAGWSRAIPVGAALIVAINLVAAVHQRWMLRGPGPHGPVGVPWRNGYSLSLTILAAAIAFLPYLLDAVGVFTKWPIGLPLWLFPIPVAIGIGYMVFHPTNIDFAPFVFVFTAAEIVSRVRGGDSLRPENAARRRGLDGLRSFWRLPLGGLDAWGAITGIVVMVTANVVGRFDGAFIWVIGISFGYFGGFMVGELDRRKHELELAQEGLAEKAAADERSRIAREVHDVIAHSLSVTMLHVSAARMALERNRNEDALEALEEAEKQGRSSLGEVRRTVGLLGPDESATAAPMPDVSDLPRLAADFRAAGLDVRMEVKADPEDIPAGSGLNVYRIVQEALTNAVKHAPGAPVSVDVRMKKDDVYVRVHNPAVNGASPNASGSGMGLQGMAERAALLGATLTTDTDEGWTVTVATPRSI